MDEAEIWINNIIRDNPEFDNIIGYEALAYVLNHTYDTSDAAIIEFATIYLERHLNDISDQMKGKFKNDVLEYEIVPEVNLGSLGEPEFLQSKTRVNIP